MQTFAYGDHPEQVGDLHLPSGDGPHPVVVLWHGGGYAPEYGRDMLTRAASDLARRGFAAWNVTYRRRGSGGGWPQTFDDARRAVEAIPGLRAPLDLEDLTALGFSAGTPLALHAVRSAAAAVLPRRAVNLAGITMLEAAARAGGEESGAHRLLGDPDDHPEVYARADPLGGLPLGVPSLHVHGDADEMVPIGMTEAYLEAAREAGEDRAELLRVPGAGHMELAQPGTPGWEGVVRWLEAGPPARA